MSKDCRNVIIAEDEPDIAEGLREIVNDLYPDVHVECVDSVDSAQERIVSLRGPVVILADYNLSGPKTGVDFYRWCQYHHPDIPFVLMSANDVTTLRAILDALRPAPPFLRKPFSVDDALRVLDPALRT